MTRAATYGRVSTGKQAQDGVSLPEQARETREHCDREGWTLADANVYADEGISAAKERPALERMLADAAAGAFDVLVIRDLDRVGRSVIDLSRIVKALDAAGVRIVTLRGRSIDVTTAEGELQFNVLASVAQYERQKIAERVSGTAAARAADGHFPGGRFRPYGYRREPIPGRKRSRLVIDPAEAEVVRRIFEEALAGRRTIEIVRDLNADGLLSQQGAPWPRVTIQRILRSHVYAGMVEVKGDVHPGLHEPIVTDAQWHGVQALLDARAGAPGKGRGRPPVGSHVFVGGLLRCPCGAPLRPRTYKGGRGSYVCSAANERGTGCGFGPVPQEAIDGPFLRSFTERYLDVDGTRQALAEQAERDRALAREATRAAERQLATTDAQRARIEADYLSGELGAATYERLSERLEDDAAAGRAKLRRLHAREAEITERLDQTDVEESVLREAAALHNAAAGGLRDAATIDAVRAIVTSLFERVELRLPNPDGGFWATARLIDQLDDAPASPQLDWTERLPGTSDDGLNVLTAFFFARPEAFVPGGHGHEVQRAVLRLDAEPKTNARTG